jgi:hypothetical protein
VRTHPLHLRLARGVEHPREDGGEEPPERARDLAVQRAVVRLAELERGRARLAPAAEQHERRPLVLVVGGPREPVLEAGVPAVARVDERADGARGEELAADGEDPRGTGERGQEVRGVAVRRVQDGRACYRAARGAERPPAAAAGCAVGGEA